MTESITLRVDPRTAANDLLLLGLVSTELGIDANRIRAIRRTRRSIDARQRRVMVNLTLQVWIDADPTEPLNDLPELEPLPADAPEVIIVGAGPAGLFAALGLIEKGLRPIILERGKDVDERRRDIARIAREGIVNPDSNYCFGEGGAGTFSDGKLYTRSRKRGPVDRVLKYLNRHGAPDDILIDAHPHIGSDRLPGIICSIREAIIRPGGKVVFNCRVTDLIITGGDVRGVVCADGSRHLGPVVLATGHSARDVYHTLHDRGVRLKPKGIAMGVRLEHPQQLIDSIMYHNPQGRGRFLPPAEYTLSTRVDGRGVYSFCMCPGGAVIPAASAPGELVVNGMSGSGRTSPRANSGMVVELLPEDIPTRFSHHGPLAMMVWQQEIEQRFFADSGSQNAPAQRMTDFVASRLSTSLPDTSYAPGVHSARVDSLLPPEIATRLQKGFTQFGQKYRGFLTPEAVVIGDETRTSSPVRIPRRPDTLSHPDLPSLYPIGEGAGYAGGIVSAAIDGLNAAYAISQNLRP